jgi:hypothetical protein
MGLMTMRHLRKGYPRRILAQVKWMSRFIFLLRVIGCAVVFTFSSSLTMPLAIVSSSSHENIQIAIMGMPSSIDAAKLAIEQYQTSQPASYSISLLTSLPSDTHQTRRFLSRVQNTDVLIVPDSEGYLKLEPFLQQLETIKHPPIISPYIPTSIGFSNEPESVKRCIFQALFTNPFQGAVIADYAINHLGAKKAGIVINKDDFMANSISNNFQYQFTKEGGSVVVEDYFGKDSNLEFFKEKNLDVLFLPTADTQIIQKIHDIVPGVTLLGSHFWEALVVKDKAKLNGLVYVTDAYAPVLPDNSGDPRFYEQYREKFLRPPMSSNAATYDIVQFVMGFFRSHDLRHQNSRGICKILLSTGAMKGVRGLFTLNDVGDPMSLVQVIKVEDNQLDWQMATSAEPYQNSYSEPLWELK